MKNIFFADSSLGEELITWLIEHYKDDIASLCVTSQESTLIALAEEYQIPWLTYASLKERYQEFTQQFDFGFLIWWPYIIPERIIATAKNFFINGHPSYLPYNRGRHYNFWALVEESPFGVTLHRVATAVDAGDILAQKKIPYTWEDTGETLYKKAQAAILALFKEQYPKIRKNEFTLSPQDLTQGNFHYSHELDQASLIELDRSYTARQLLNLLRARTFLPYDACHFEDNGTVYEVRVTITEKKQKRK